MNLKGKVAIVTGASRGIGRAIALRLGSDGATVVVNYTQQIAKAQEVVEKIKQAGGEALAVQADISSVADIRRLFTTALNTFGRLDIVVNNAAIGIFKPHKEVTEEEFDRIFSINTKGAFFILQEAARHIADNGRIVNISVAGTAMPFAMAGLNNGSRAANDQFTLCLAKELGARGITANNVALGLTQTESLFATVPESIREQARQQIPLGRLGEPEDIADIVAFLCSPDGRWLTAQTIRATGGLV
jgi:3-oxoacyl-[acyl-carrier protein] reductase